MIASIQEEILLKLEVSEVAAFFQTTTSHRIPNLGVAVLVSYRGKLQRSDKLNTRADRRRIGYQLGVTTDCRHSRSLPFSTIGILTFYFNPLFGSIVVNRQSVI